MRRFDRVASALTAGVFVVVGGAAVSCSRTVDPVPLRTFERAQNMDVVCLEVADAQGNALPLPRPAAQSRCTAAPAGSLTFATHHLFGLVTQTARGEVAVVDLTAGRIVDLDQSTPGINFLTVGTLPTDVVSAPNGAISFVATAEPNKWAIYALPSAPPAQNPRESRGILGDGGGMGIPTIADFPVCSLPQAPSSMAIMPRPGDPFGGYDLAVILPGVGRSPTKLAVISPEPLLVGAKVESGPVSIEPGSLSPCPIRAVVELSGNMPTAVPLGARWSDGVGYVDGGVKTPVLVGSTCAAPGATGSPDGGSDAGAGDAAASDAASPDSGADASPEETVAIPPLPGDTPRAVRMAKDGDTLYLADEALPLIHVIDWSDPAGPRELSPLVATSVSNIARRVSVGAIAVSPATRDYKRYLYAVDRHDGSIMVFDVTERPSAQSNAARVPMRRPHPELNPLAPVDRIAFASAVESLAFVRHDFPLVSEQDRPLTAARTGLLCNPNPNANADPDRGIELPFRDPGAYYRFGAPAGAELRELGPLRLRGVFAFATLTSGQMAVIDVDDWDAPCRRPDPMGVKTRAAGAGFVETDETASLGPPIFSQRSGAGVRSLGVSDLAPLMPEPASRDDLDPYHAPVSFYTSNGGAVSTGVTNEAFFPVSAPHRPRSLFLLRRDPTNGIHIPYLPGLAQLRSKGSPINTVGPNSLRHPLMLPTFSALPDPGQVKTPTEPRPAGRELSKDQALLDVAHLPLESATADVRFAWEDPEVHVDQDWTLTYEGIVPGFDQVTATVEPKTSPGNGPDYTSAVLRVPNGLLCQKGVVDQRVASQRSKELLDAFASATLPSDGGPLLTPPRRLEHKLGDYVQVIDDLLPSDHPYWGTQEPAGDSCWEPEFSTADARYGLCSRTFGVASDESLRRDFPIVEAYDDRLVIGAYGDEDPANPTVARREVVVQDPGKAPFLKLLRCCFHRQVRFNVRAGAEWVAKGSVSGFLHSMTSGEGGACVPSCRPEDALLNGRAPQLPRPLGIDASVPPPSGLSAEEWRARVARRREALKAFLSRTSPLAFRNPMFSVLMWNETDAARGDSPPERDFEWAFAVRGQYSPLAVNLGARTVAVSPQTLKFIEPLRQLAVVDASNQGLQLFDLRTLTAVREPYF